MVPAICSILANNQPYSTEHMSVEGGLIAQSSHTHSLFRDNIADVYYKLGEATCSRSDFLTLIAQYTGADK